MLSLTRIREVQIKTILRCLFSSIWENWPKSTTLGTHSLGESLWKQTLSYIACGRCIWHDLSAYCLIHEKWHRWEVIHGSALRNSERLETAKLSIARGVLQSILLHSGIPCCIKKKEHACHVDVLSVNTGCALCHLLGGKGRNASVYSCWCVCIRKPEGRASTCEELEGKWLGRTRWLGVGMGARLFPR